MVEYSVPARVRVDPTTNLTDAVFRNAGDHPDVVSFERKLDGHWQPVTAAEFAQQVRQVAAGLVASGVQPGDRVALMSATRYEWTLVDYAIWTAGAVTVPIYETSSAEQIQWILSDSGAVGAFLETDVHRAAYDEVAGQLPGVKNVWMIGDGAVDDLVKVGASVTDHEVDERRRGVSADTLATIIYTSGTTGRPKGCELTHRNFLFDALAATDTMIDLFTQEDSTLLFLPLAHVFARLIQVGCVERRVKMAHSHDIKNLLPDFQAYRPTFILSVPRVFEKVYNQAKQKANAEGKGRIFDLAEQVAVNYSRARDDSAARRLALEVPHRVFDALVYSKLRNALGGRVRYAVSGGAPLGARLGHFFRGIGVTILEGYGLTETTAASTCNAPDAIKIGTVGRPVPGVSVRIADDAEVLVKGENIFLGYFNNETATKETLEPDGWFHTGDMGELDRDGYLRITGRKKELIVTAGGKNVAPAVLEDRLRQHALISQAMVVGDQKPFIACLLTIDPEAWPDWLSSHGKPAHTDVAHMVDDPDLRAELQAAVDDANKAVSKAESIKAFRILDRDFTQEGGHLTPTLKLKRNIVLKDFADEIEALYSGGNTRV